MNPKTLLIPGVGEVSLAPDGAGGDVLRIGDAKASDLVVPAHVAKALEARRQTEMRAVAARVLAAEGRRALERIRVADLAARPHRSKASRRRIAKASRCPR